MLRPFWQGGFERSLTARFDPADTGVRCQQLSIVRAPMSSMGTASDAGPSGFGCSASTRPSFTAARRGGPAFPATAKPRRRVCRTRSEAAAFATGSLPVTGSGEPSSWPGWVGSIFHAGSFSAARPFTSRAGTMAAWSRGPAANEWIICKVTVALGRPAQSSVSACRADRVFNPPEARRRVGSLATRQCT